jgi:hypothetical protein
MLLISIMAVPYAEYDPFLLLLQAIAQSILTVEFIILTILLWIRYKNRQKSEIKYLFKAIGYLAIGIAISTIPMILCLTKQDITWNYGLPLIYNDNHLWWSNFTYLFMTISCYNLIKFCQPLFKKPTNNSIKIYIVAIIIFNIWSIYHGIINYVPGEASLTIPMSILFILITFYAWGSLSIYARQDYKKSDPSIYQLGVKLIAISAFATFLGYFVWAVSMILGMHQQTGPFLWFLNCITGFLLYLGYALPPWFRKFFKYEE